MQIFYAPITPVLFYYTKKMRLGIALVLTLLVNIAASARSASVVGDSVVPYSLDLDLLGCTDR